VSAARTRRGRSALRYQQVGGAMDGDLPLCDEDKAKILSGNAKRLFRM
jgi:predicted TIM-barrel fold metal-dependent hydrolase